MEHSSGALLYSFSPDNEIGVILGLENNHWLPFKGTNNINETYEEAAIREIFEETCGLVKIDVINLDHSFSTKYKHYHIGLVEVPFSIVNDFTKQRQIENRCEFIEKKSIKFFPLNELKNNLYIHSITMSSILFYWNKLITAKKGIGFIKSNKNERIRYLAVY